MNYDFATPGTGPIKLNGPSNPSVELEKYRSFNTSLRSKDDLNLNPIPEGNLKSAAGNLPQTRSGIYAIETDRGDLYPTIETQINMKGQQTFKNRLQDPVKPTTKETLLHTAEGNMGPVIKKQTAYSQFVPTYAKVGETYVKTSGYSNYSLKSATEYSYFPGPSTTGNNNSALQNPNVVVNNLWKRPDNNVDGPGTFKGVTPDSTRTQVYKKIVKPTTSGLKLTYNVEAKDTTVLGQNLTGVEDRYTNAYQIAPLLNNPLHAIWNPENKGEIPSFYCNSNPGDFSYIQQTRLEPDEYITGGYNQVWSPDPVKDSTNAYVLSMSAGLHNQRLEWNKAVNNKPGVIYDPESSIAPGKCYSSNRSIPDLYQYDLQKAYQNNVFTTLGDPTAGFLTTTS